MSKTDQKHIVYSNGFVLSGFVLSEVSAKLSTLYRKPENKIRRHLLNGEARKVKSFDKVTDAQKLAAELTKIGLNCYILSPDTEDSITLNEHSIDVSASDVPSESITTSTDSESQLSQTSSTAVEADSIHQDSKPKSKLKWILPFALLIIIVLGGTYYYVSKWLTPQLPTSVGNVEAALFTSQKPSGVIHGDLIQMRRLLSLTDDAALEKKTIQALSKVPLLNSPGDKATLLNATNYITSSISFSDTQKNNWLTVLQGNYTALNLDTELSKLYLIEKTDNGLLTLKYKPETSSPKTDIICPASDSDVALKSPPTVYAHLSNTQVVLSSSKDKLTSFVSAYNNPPELDQIQLSEWQDYRGESLFAMSLFDKQLLQQDFIARASSNALFGDTTYQFIGVRASVSPVKQALEVSFDAEMNDKTVSLDLASKIKEGINKLNSDNRESFPSVTDLLSRIDVESDRGLHITLTLDKSLANELEDLTSNFFSMLFNPTQIESGNDAEAEAEVLEEHAWDYALNEKMLIKAKPPVDQFIKFQPIAINNGVAIFLDSMGVKPVSPFDAEQGNALQITIKAKRSAPFDDAFFGWSNSGIKQSLSITDVIDNKGSSLLTDEHCKKAKFSQDLNHQPSDRTNYSNGVIDTSKTVRLLDSATIEKIRMIKGHYSLEVPINTMVKALSLDNPFVEWPAGSFRLTKMNQGSVSYILVDDEERLLEVRALNKNGQALSSSSSFSSDKRYTKKFKGDVASIELVIAGNFERQEFTFKVDNIIPKPAVNNTSSPSKTTGKPVLFNKADAIKFSKPLLLKTLSTKETKELSRKLDWQSVSLDRSKDHELGHTTTKSGVIFFKHDDKSNWNHKLTGLVLLPFDMSMQFIDGLATIDLTLDGEPISSADLLMSRTKVNDKPISAFSVDSREYDIGTFSIPFAEQRTQISEIQGTLKYKLPTKVSIKTVNLLNQDTSLKGLTFVGYDFSWNGSITYQLSDELASAYLIILSTNDGLESVGKINEENGVTTVVFDQVANLKKVDFHFIKKAHSMTENFKFTPVYK